VRLQLVFFATCTLIAATLACVQAEPATAGAGNFLAVVDRDKKAHVAFLGGSITQKEMGHVKMVADWLEESFPDTEFTFTNAGLSSTCSLAGAYRFRGDVEEAGKPDLLIVEFAVNDDQDAGHSREMAIRGLEGIVRQYRSGNPYGDIISVQFVNPEILATKQAGEEAVSVAAHKAVARHYGISSVDVGEALAAEIAAGRMTWDAGYKGTHPNEKGYRFASDLIISVLENSVANPELTSSALPDPLHPGSFDQIDSLESESLAWLGGWRHEPVSRDLLPVGQIRGDYEGRMALRAEEAGCYLYHTILGSSLGAFVLAGPDAGALEVSVDGGEWNRVELYHRHSANLNYPRAVILADGLSPTYHQVAIRTAKASAETGGESATILSFFVDR